MRIKGFKNFIIPHQKLKAYFVEIKLPFVLANGTNKYPARLII